MELTNLNKDRKTRRKSGALDLGSMMYGKIPPQSVRIEETLLGRIINDQSIFDQVTEIITEAKYFYVEANQRIFKAMLQMRHLSQTIDLLSLVEQLKKNEELDLIGGPYYITKLTNGLQSFSIEQYCKIIAEKFISRELIRISGEILTDAYEDSTDVFELLDKAEADLFAITFNNLKSDYQNVGGNDMSILLNHIETLRNKNEDVTGITSGFKTIDKLTGGWQTPDFVVLAARPSVGKTAFALELAKNAAKSGVGAGFFSLEMSRKQCQERLLSSQSGIALKKITRGKLDEPEMKIIYKDGAEALSRMNIFIDDTAGLSIYQLRHKARQMRYRDKVGIIFIDYIQLMSGISNERNNNREQEISKISRDLKGLAKELQIPIIALSQLSREVEKRKEGNKMPQLSDLRESGAIEQDADIVAFLYRPEYYGIHVNDAGKNNSGETHVRFAKHRNGEVSTVKLMSELWRQRFLDIVEENNKKTQDPFPVGTNQFIPIGAKLANDEEEFDFT